MCIIFENFNKMLKMSSFMAAILKWMITVNRFEIVLPGIKYGKVHGYARFDDSNFLRIDTVKTHFKIYLFTFFDILNLFSEYCIVYLLWDTLYNY